MRGSQPTSAPARVLLIDDDPAFGRYACLVLPERGGFEVTHVLDPAAGLRYIETEPWDLVVADSHDVHQDHRNTHSAAMVATRRIGRVYCFQSPSATVDFRPTHFVVIDDHIGRKLKAIAAFACQVAVRDYLEPGLIVSTARYRSRFCDGNHAEAFEAVRDRASIRAAADAPGCARLPATAQPGRGPQAGPEAADRR